MASAEQSATMPLACLLRRACLPPCPLQGLSCAVVGCANMGPKYRASASPIVHLLIAQSLQRITSFNMQVRRYCIGAAEIQLLPVQLTAVLPGKHDTACRSALVCQHTVALWPHCRPWPTW